MKSIEEIRNARDRCLQSVFHFQSMGLGPLDGPMAASGATVSALEWCMEEQTESALSLQDLLDRLESI